jgi:ABC-type nickel/cobalt efflux system permease component RcnA
MKKRGLIFLIVGMFSVGIVRAQEENSDSPLTVILMMILALIIVFAIWALIRTLKQKMNKKKAFTEDEQLVEYVKACRKKGYSDIAIKQRLVLSGYKSPDVNRIMRLMK